MSPDSKASEIHDLVTSPLPSPLIFRHYSTKSGGIRCPVFLHSLLENWWPVNLFSSCIIVHSYHLLIWYMLSHNVCYFFHVWNFFCDFDFHAVAGLCCPCRYFSCIYSHCCHLNNCTYRVVSSVVPLDSSCSALYCCTNMFCIGSVVSLLFRFSLCQEHTWLSSPYCLPSAEQDRLFPWSPRQGLKPWPDHVWLSSGVARPFAGRLATGFRSKVITGHIYFAMTY